jgi:hypothetical protein
MTTAAAALLKVDAVNAEYTDSLENWTLVDTLMNGTDAMRKAGKAYLPIEEKETEAAYSARLTQTVLFPGYKRAVETYIGKPLEKQITVDENADARLREWLKNVDLNGRSIDAFARDVFRAALSHGITYILVDYPTIVDAESKTKAEEEALGVRPYGVHLFASQIIGWKSTTVNGRQALTQIRILEIVEEPDPTNPEFGLVKVQQIRVLELGRARVYRKSANAVEWTLISDVPTTMIDEIPLVVIYTNRVGFMHAKPPLIDLAHINVAHWQSTSDQRNILHIARVPFLHIATQNADEVNKLTIGAARAIITGMQETVAWVEHQGTAIAAGADDLETLKQDMASYGMELMMKPGGTVTATQRVLDRADSDSVLSVMARALREGLEEMCRFMLKWVKVPADTSGILNVQTDFRIVGDSAELTTLWNMRMNGDLSQEQFWIEMKRRGILADGFDPEVERTLLESEIPPNTPNMTETTDDDPGNANRDEEDDEEEAA